MHARSGKVSIDNAVMERTAHAAVVPFDAGWSDVGSWLTLWEIADKDGADNVIVGDVLTEHTSSSYIRSTRPLVTAIGVKDMIVATDDAVLIMSKGRAQDVKVLGKLPLNMIEVQSGAYVEEDDIMRLDDDFNRA